MLIEVMGAVRLSTDEGVPVEVAERKLRLLLVSLVASGGEPVSADVLIDRLWGERLPADPKKVLRAKLSHLRTALDQAQPGGRDLLVHTPVGYRLAAEPAVVDAERFKDAVERARHTTLPEEKTASLLAALAMWRGEPYGDAVDEVWLAPMVAELRDARGDARELLVDALIEQGAPERAIEQVGGAVEDHPTRERLIAALMHALYQVGRQHDALEMFESLRHRLAESLGVDPSPAVRELHGRILRQDPTLGAAGPSASPVRAAPGRTNVPAETSPMIGRLHESSHIDAMLAQSRLVTLTGIGGVGKTRLALHVARAQKARSERGPWFIDLTELTTTPDEHLGSAARVAALVVAALGLPEQSARSDLDRVCEALASRAALLVLDNCEHVVAEAAVFVSELLRRTPGARLLATSREPLGLPDEHRYDVGTLSTESSDDAEASEAVQFFAARARAAEPGFCLDGQTTPAVTELCRRLDGLPLALELAAGRIRGISAQDLLERLSDRLNILRRPGHGVPRRQQTLRGMIDWSWSLLDDAERAVLRRLAVHPGTFGLAAAEVICADAPGAAAADAVEQAQVVDVLIGLVERSMVTTGTGPTGVRYGLLESIATYAGEKLDASGERRAVVQRHLDHYLRFARRADAHLRGPEQRPWLARLEDERTQLRNAFDEAVHMGNGPDAVGLAAATFWYHWMTGRKTHLHQDLRTAAGLCGPHDDTYAMVATLEACVDEEADPRQKARRVEEALALFDEPAAQARVRWFAGSSLLACGLRDAGERHVDAAVSTLTEKGMDWDVAVAACQRDWFVVTGWGDPPRGLPDGRDPEQVLRAAGDGFGISLALGLEYCVAELGGHHVGAANAAERVLGICLDLGLLSEAAYWYAAHAIAAVRSGDVSAARDRLTAGRDLAADIGDTYGLRFADFAESMIARYEGDLVRARTLLDVWTAYADTSGSDAVTRFESGFLAAQEGHIEWAETAFRTLHAPIVRAGQGPSTARLLELAAAIRASGSAADAAELLGTAGAVRTRSGADPSSVERYDFERIRALVRAQLTERQFSDAVARGERRDLDEQLAATSSGPALRTDASG